MSMVVKCGDEVTVSAEGADDDDPIKGLESYFLPTFKKPFIMHKTDGGAGDEWEGFCGKGVYGAIAIGKISIFKQNKVAVNRRRIKGAALEFERLEEAKAESTRQIQEIYDKVLKEVGESNAQIFEIHTMMEDDDYKRAGSRADQQTMQ